MCKSTTYSSLITNYRRFPLIKKSQQLKNFELIIAYNTRLIDNFFIPFIVINFLIIIFNLLL